MPSKEKDPAKSFEKNAKKHPNRRHADQGDSSARLPGENRGNGRARPISLRETLALLFAGALALSSASAAHATGVPFESDWVGGDSSQQWTLSGRDDPSQNDLIFERIFERLFVEGFPVRESRRERARARLHDEWMQRVRSGDTAAFSVLERGFSRLDGSIEHQLAFFNTPADFEEVARMTIGYCWGHATVTRAFAQFADFAPDDDRASSEAAPAALDPARIQSWIDSVLANRLTRIPGFRDLREFSSHPAVAKPLKEAVVRVWTDLAVSYRAIRAYVGNLKKMDGRDFERFLDRTAQRLDAFQKPKIYLVTESRPYSAHILLANRIELSDRGNRKLCLIDNSSRPAENARCGAFFELLPDGTLEYQGGFERKTTGLRFVEFVPEEKSEIVQAVQGATGAGL
jgi:hypothetical protein